MNCGCIDTRRHGQFGRVTAGRFTGPRAEELCEASIEGAHDEEAGDVTEIGYWYGLFAAERIILQVDDCGFAHTVEYRDEAETRRFWAQLVEAVNTLA